MDGISNTDPLFALPIYWVYEVTSTNSSKLMEVMERRTVRVWLKSTVLDVAADNNVALSIIYFTSDSVRQMPWLITITFVYTYVCIYT